VEEERGGYGEAKTRPSESGHWREEGKKGTGVEKEKQGGFPLKKSKSQKKPLVQGKGEEKDRNYIVRGGISARLAQRKVRREARANRKEWGRSSSLESGRSPTPDP